MEAVSSYRYLKLWKTIGAILIVGSIAVSLLPSAYRFSTSHIDKLWHALTYASLMFWFVQLYVRKVHWQLALAFIAMGAVIEGLQYLTGYRTADFADAVANTVGVLVGWTLFQTPLGRVLAAVDTLLSKNLNSAES